MINLLLFSIFIVMLVSIFKKLMKMVILKRNLDKKRKIRELIIEAAPYMFDIERHFRRGDFDNTPTIKKQLLKIIAVYNMYMDSKDIDLNIDIKKVMFDTIKNEKMSLSVDILEEIKALASSNGELFDTLYNGLNCMHTIMSLNHPVKQKVCTLILDVQKSFIFKILREFLGTQKESNKYTRNYSLEYVSASSLLFNFLNTIKY